MRVVVIFAVVVLAVFGVLASLRFVASDIGAARVEEPKPGGDELSEPTGGGDPAMADIVFEGSVSVEEMLRAVGEDNRKNITMVESMFEAGGEERWESQSIPPGLATADEIKRHLARNRMGALADMSAPLEGSVMEEPGAPEGAREEIDREVRRENRRMREAIEDPATREVRISKVSLEGDSVELERLPAEPSDAIENISVMTQGELMEMIEGVRKEAERRGDPPPEFD